MKDKLIQYVNLLFAARSDCEDLKQEILQNTLDRYDDLVAQGKTPEAAYQLAIAGIGDINELLAASSPYVPSGSQEASNGSGSNAKGLRAIAVALYILCPVPVIVLSRFRMEEIGVCGLLTIVAIATALMVYTGKKTSAGNWSSSVETYTPKQELRKSIQSAVWAVAVVIYLIVSFLTFAWYITWLIFPIAAAVNGLIRAILDLMEVNSYEN